MTQNHSTPRPPKRPSLAPRLGVAVALGLCTLVAGFLGYALFLDQTPPQVVIRADLTEVGDNAPVSFSARGSRDNPGILSYVWDFGDGTSATGAEASHAYSEAGRYVVTLTARDLAGNESTASRVVLVRQYWADAFWRTSPPEEQGMDTALLESMMEAIERGQHAIHSVIVVRNGHIVWEEYLRGWRPHRPHEIQSCTKSVTSVLIGIAIRQGLIDSVDQRMVEFFPNHTIANLDERKGCITLEHLLTMSVGMDWHELDYPYDDPRNTLGQMWVSDDAVQYCLDRPMVNEPGESWAYNSCTSIILGGILEQVTGHSVNAWAREVLFDPIGIGDVFWALVAGGHYHTDGGLFMRPRDMARLGYLMLMDGAWDGQPIVSPEWVEASTQALYRTPWGEGYGYQWWTLPRTDVFMATGHYDQRIYVSPEHNLVAVFTAHIEDEDPHPTENWVRQYVLAACQR